MNKVYLKRIMTNSAQIVVPYKECINNCMFCISCMNPVAKNIKFIESKELEVSYIKKLKYLKDIGCKNVVITGDNEPLMNKNFLLFFSATLNQAGVRFDNIEIQTSGVFLNEYLLSFLRNKIHINLVCISVASLNVNINANIMGFRNELIYDFNKISYYIHQTNIKLRITIIMTNWFNKYENDIEKLFKDIFSLFKPNQITFKILKNTSVPSDVHYWIENHSASINTIKNLSDFLSVNTKVISFYAGMNIYEYMGMSIMLDNDCMKAKLEKGYRYLILLPNGKLRESWF